MNVDSISGLITSVGFPIVAFLICGYFLKYVFDENNKTINETLNKLTNAINSLENAIITNLKKGDN